MHDELFLLALGQWAERFLNQCNHLFRRLPQFGPENEKQNHGKEAVDIFVCMADRLEVQRR